MTHGSVDPEAVRAAALAGRTVAVTGPAGIGKSRVVRAAARADDVAAQCLQPFAAMSYRALAYAIGVPLSGAITDVAADVIAAVDERLLIVEDLHWCDPPTMAVLQALVGRVGMIVTSRHDTPFGPESDVEHVVVPPLDRRRAVRLVRQLHPQLSDAERQRLIAAADGNPLLLRHLARDGAVSPTLRAALTDRLLGYPARTLAELGKLALRGAPVDSTALRLPEGGAASITERRPDGTIWFVHGLFAVTVLELLGESRLDELRRDLIAEVPLAEAAQLLLALGDHRAAAEAAQVAADGADPSSRSDLLILAADAFGAEATNELLLDAADAALDANRPAVARSLAERVQGPHTVQASAGLRLARSAWLDGDPAAASTIIERSLAAVRGTGSIQEAELIVEQAFIAVRGRVGDPGIVQLADQAAAVALRRGVAVARALNTAGLARSHTGAPGWDEYFTDAERSARADGDDEERLGACYWRLSSLGFYGPMSQAYELGAVMVAETRVEGPRRWYHHFLGAHIVHVSGRGEVPDELVRECRRLLRESPSFRNRAQVDLALVVALVDRGDVAGAAHVVDDGEAWAPSAESRALLACARCEIALAMRDVESMRSALDELRACGAGFFGLNALAESAAIHLAFEHPGAIEPPVASTVLTPVLGAVEFERQAHEMQLAGKVGAAVEACALASAQWQRQGMRRFARRAELAPAEIAMTAGQLDRAAAALANVADGPVDVTARRRITLEREIARRIALDRLTPRETEILQLVARGLTSRQIADALCIGVATVDTHIASSLRRLGARTRRQAASLVHH